MKLQHQYDYFHSSGCPGSERTWVFLDWLMLYCRMTGGFKMFIGNSTALVSIASLYRGLKDRLTYSTAIVCLAVLAPPKLLIAE